MAWIRTKGQVFLKPIANINPVVAAWDLGLGESHVLSWAIQHPNYEAILDDRAARKAAASLQVPIRGTLSIILLAKREGYISSTNTTIEKLIESRFSVEAGVLAKALNLAEP